MRLAQVPQPLQLPAVGVQANRSERCHRSCGQPSRAQAEMAPTKSPRSTSVGEPAESASPSAGAAVSTHSLFRAAPKALALRQASLVPGTTSAGSNCNNAGTRSGPQEPSGAECWATRQNEPMNRTMEVRTLSRCCCSWIAGRKHLSIPNRSLRVSCQPRRCKPVAAVGENDALSQQGIGMEVLQRWGAARHGSEVRQALADGAL